MAYSKKSLRKTEIPTNNRLGISSHSKTSSPLRIQRAPIGNSNISSPSPQLRSGRTPNPRLTPFTSRSGLLSRGINIRYRPTGIISRGEFERYVRTNFNVTAIRTGTQAEQERRSTRRNLPPVTIPNWQSWDPGSASEDYSNIINGIEDMIDRLGAIPSIRRILFFKVEYKPDPSSGIGIRQPNIGASFGAGELTIYEAYTGSTRPAIGISQVGQPTPTAGGNQQDNIKGNILHELGHGVAEAAMASQNNETFVLFRQQIGWTPNNPSELYDIGQPTVRAAIAANSNPPPQHLITSSRWSDPTVSEQPMSSYAVFGGPGEDFAESITAYVMTPNVLMQRSPRRYEFIRRNIFTWRRQLTRHNPALIRSQPGDYNLPNRNRRFA